MLDDVVVSNAWVPVRGVVDDIDGAVPPPVESNSMPEVTLSSSNPQDQSRAIDTPYAAESPAKAIVNPSRSTAPELEAVRLSQTALT